MHENPIILVEREQQVRVFIHNIEDWPDRSRFTFTDDAGKAMWWPTEYLARLALDRYSHGVTVQAPLGYGSDLECADFQTEKVHTEKYVISCEYPLSAKQEVSGAPPRPPLENEKLFERTTERDCDAPKSLHRLTRTSLLLACLCFSGYASAGPQASTEHAFPVNPPTSKDTLLPPADRKAVPDFQLRDNRGHLFRLSQQRGKVVVVNFWATWCGGCNFELPYFVGYDRKYAKQGLTTVGVAMDDEGFRVVKPFWKSKRMPYPTVIGSETLGKSLGLTGMPFTLLIDKQGRAAIAHNGVIDRQDFEDHIQQLLRS